MPKPVPDGYASVTPKLIVPSARKAIAFYKKAFGAEELTVSEGPNGSVMHAEIRIGNSIVMLADENPAWGCKSPATLGGSPVQFLIYVENLDTAWKRATEAGCKIQMLPTDMFWGDRMAALDDPFGFRWNLAQHTTDLTPDQIEKAKQEFFAKMKKP